MRVDVSGWMRLISCNSKRRTMGKTHAVTVVINRLRKKIENNMTEPVYIRNVFGVGYTFGE